MRYAGAFVLVLLLASCGGTSEKSPSTVGTIAFIRASPDDSLPDVGPIVVMSADGTGQRHITELSAVNFDRSSDGQRIVYDGLDSSGGLDAMYLTDIGTGARQRLAVADCYAPVISDDGTRIACEYIEPNLIKVVNPDGSGAQTITPDCCWRPSWSPDGKKIAYISYGRYTTAGLKGPSGVFVMNADGTNKRLLSEEWEDNEAPAWSPDGQTLAFTSYGIWLVPVSGGPAKEIVSNDNKALKDVAWSPDGDSLAYARGGDGDYEIYVVNSDGSNVRKLTDNEPGVQDESPSWSPDGTALAFTTSRDGNHEIYTMNADGSGLTRLTTNEVDDITPIWSGKPG